VPGAALQSRKPDSPAQPALTLTSIGGETSAALSRHDPPHWSSVDQLRVLAQARVARAQERRRVMVLNGGLDLRLVLDLEEAERWAGQPDRPE
jgi:hypothetical protein